MLGSGGGSALDGVVLGASEVVGSGAGVLDGDPAGPVPGGSVEGEPAAVSSGVTVPVDWVSEGAGVEVEAVGADGSSSRMAMISVLKPSSWAEISVSVYVVMW